MKFRVETLKKKYGEKPVLSIEQLSVSSGTFLGIIGANGAGKSTFLNLLAGLDQPSSGAIYYGDNESTSPPLNQMTMVFQRPYMMRTTVEKNIVAPLVWRGWSQKDMDSRATELMEDLGILHLRNQKAWTLSGGESQKVALARAISFRPKLLLLDEPTANIDPKSTSEIEHILRKINNQEQTTILYITHNLPQAKRLCKEILFLHLGQALEFSTNQKFFSESKNELTQRFLEGELLL